MVSQPNVFVLHVHILYKLHLGLRMCKVSEK